MGWSIGYDTTWKRDVGYGVPAMCDHPGCGAEIDRGLSYVCGGEPFGGERGCGLYFCSAHQVGYVRSGSQLCDRCYPRRKAPHKPTPDVRAWIEHKLTDESWQRWRDESPQEVAELRAALGVEGPFTDDLSDELIDAHLSLAYKSSGLNGMTGEKWDRVVARRFYGLGVGVATGLIPVTDGVGGPEHG